MSTTKPSTRKIYRKKPTVVAAWTFPETQTAQFDLSRELEQLGADFSLYDYAVEKSDTPFQDGAFWRWTQAHVAAGTHSDFARSHIARIGDIIILNPVTGWGVMDSDTFAQAHEEVTGE